MFDRSEVKVEVDEVIHSHQKTFPKWLVGSVKLVTMHFKGKGRFSFTIAGNTGNKFLKHYECQDGYDIFGEDRFIGMSNQWK